MSGFLGAMFASLAGAVTSVVDPLFNYVTLLLNGDGTNGQTNKIFLDSSSNTFTITPTGTPTQGTFSPFSQTGWSGSFNGTSTYITTPDSTAFNLAGTAFTLEAFVFPNNVTTRQTIIEKRFTSGAFTPSWWMQISTTGAVEFSYGSDVLSTAGVILANQWNHMAVCHDGTNLTMYANGNRVYGPTAIAITNQSALISIGGSSLSGLYMNGSISNLRVTKGGALYSGATYTVPTSALTTTVSAGTVSLLTLQSNRFVDNASPPNVLTIAGTPSIQAFSPFAPTIPYSAAVVGGSGYFNGTTDYLVTASNAALTIGASSFTTEFFVYHNVSGVAEQYLDSATNGFSLSKNTSNQVVLTQAGVSTLLTTTLTVPILQNTHIAVVRNVTSVVIYINGVSAGTATLATSFTNTAFTIGRQNSAGSTYINGYLSNLRLVVGTAVYTSAFTPPTAPLTAISGTSLLLNFTNAGIADATAKNDLITVGSAQVAAGSTSTTATGVISTTSIVVASATGLAVGQLVTGTGIGTNAVVTVISGTTITLSVANSGTVSGSVLFTNPVKFGTGSMKFNGTTDYLNSPFAVIPSTGDFTIEGWFNPASTANQTIYFLNGNTSSYAGLRLDVVGTNKLNLLMATSAAAWAINSGSVGTVTIGTWSFISIIRSGGTITLYVDGTSVYSSTAITSTTALYVGAYNFIGAAYSTTITNFLNGYLDDLRITKGIARTNTVPTAPFPVQ